MAAEYCEYESYTSQPGFRMSQGAQHGVSDASETQALFHTELKVLSWFYF